MPPRSPEVSKVPFGAWDLEALNWTDFRVGAWVTPEGDSEVFYTRERMAERIGQWQGRAYAHYGGRYDFFFLPPLQQVILSGSGILKAKHDKASVYDSWFLFQMSLAKLGKAVGRAKLEDRSDRIAELTLEETAEHALNDSWVLCEGLKRHREWVSKFPHPNPRWPATAGATAVYVMEALEPDNVARLRAQRLSTDEWLDHAGAVSGGRVEIHWMGQTPGRVYAYDINSSYPFSWVESPLPMGPWVPVESEHPRLPGVYLCDVEQDREHFPVVAPECAWRFDGEAWLTSEELRTLRDARGAARVKRGYVSRTVGALGHRFVAEMYRQKLAGEPWAKVSINSAHGKTCQDIWNQTYYRMKDGAHAIDRELSLPGWSQRPLIGAFLLARARLRLWRTMEALREAGWRVYYLDTDCIHTDCPPDRFPGFIGERLGEWKLENNAAYGVYVAPKVYALVNDDGSAKLVCKGFPKQVVTLEILQRAARGERVPLRHDAGLDGFKSLGGDWRPRLKRLRRTLYWNTGGKHHGTDGAIFERGRVTGRPLYYPDVRRRTGILRRGESWEGLQAVEVQGGEARPA